MEEHDDEEKVRYAAPFIMLAVILIVVAVVRWDYIHPSIENAWNYIFQLSPPVEECHYTDDGCQNYNRWGQ